TLLLVAAKLINGSEVDEVSGGVDGKQSAFYLGEDPPGAEPKLFAPGLVSVDGATDYVISFSEDGREIYWSRASSGVMNCSLGDDGWSEPAPFDFGVKYPGPGGEVHIMKGGKCLLMNQFRRNEEGMAGGIYRLKRINGSWSDSELLISNSMRATSTDDGVIYVTDITYHLNKEEGKDTGVIARYVLSGDEAIRTEDPGEGINTEYVEAHPFIAPDESYIIFNSPRPGGKGEADLYMSYRQKDGSWGEVINLEALNTPYGDWGATVTRDGKYLFFTRNMTGQGDIYWVRADFIEEMRPE
ncbi:MAG: hypothetical protein KOO63_14915, partial [Bacteroidales bacterium]|nr:hypothetical protein [Candidatus Latescibacterota bacterium]